MKFNIPQGLNIRPAKPTDKPFLEKLHSSMRQELRFIDGEKEFVESIVTMQFQAQNDGYGSQFPNAMYFIIEKFHEPIGKATLDFGHNEVRLIDIAFLPQATGHGFGRAIIQSFQCAAAKTMLPMTLSVLQHNHAARKLYALLGFKVEAVKEPYYFMAWYPNRKTA